jgi:hypothetical protein
MATLLRPDGTRQTIHPLRPKTGFKLEELYSILECEIVQVIQTQDGQLMIMDEESKIKANIPPVNPAATKLLHEAGGMLDDFIVGPVVLCNHLEFQ